MRRWFTDLKKKKNILLHFDAYTPLPLPVIFTHTYTQVILYLNGEMHVVFNKMHTLWEDGCECHRPQHIFTCIAPTFPKETNRPGASVRSFVSGAQRETLMLFILPTPS